MQKFLTYFFIPITFTACVELYDFKVDNDRPSLVVEGQISNISFNKSRGYPADGRYFSVKLRRTSPVTNTRDQMVSNAQVKLEDTRGDQWYYTASEEQPGIYMLYDKEFQAEEGLQYKLLVTLPSGEKYDSDWERLPEYLPEPIGDIDFEEVELLQYEYRNGERTLTNVRGINVKIELPILSFKDPVYYKWDFSPTWVYRAPMAHPMNGNYQCWISNPYYLSDYVVHRDYIGGYKKDLFFLQVDGNDRIFDRLSVLIHQYSMSENYYDYWKEIQQQNERKGLFDPPPFNLKSNLHSENPDQEVFGYFGVVEEQGFRWDFNRNNLSYPVPNTWDENCQNRIISPWDKCISCFNYSEYATNVKPEWWDK